MRKPRTHTRKFLEKLAKKRMAEDDLRRTKRERREAEIAGALEGLRELGWTGFMKKNGKAAGRRLAAKVKRAFPEEYAKCCRRNRRDASLSQAQARSFENDL